MWGGGHVEEAVLEENTKWYLLNSVLRTEYKHVVPIPCPPTLTPSPNFCQCLCTKYHDTLACLSGKLSNGHVQPPCPLHPTSPTFTVSLRDWSQPWTLCAQPPPLRESYSRSQNPQQYLFLLQSIPNMKMFIDQLGFQSVTQLKSLLRAVVGILTWKHRKHCALLFLLPFFQANLSCINIVFLVLF